MTTKPPLRRRLRQRLRRGWRQLTQEQATPNRLGLAVAVGVVVGCSPFYGFQNLMSLGLAWVFRLNKLAVLAGAQVSSPPFTPLIILAGAQLGELMINGRLLPLTLAGIQQMGLKEVVSTVVVNMAVGGLFVGAALGLVLGGLTSKLVRNQRERRLREPTLRDEEVDALADRLDAVSGRYRSYGSWKVRLDPVYPLALEKLAGAREVVDLGAGMGLMEALFAARYPEVRIRAVEWDERKVAVARVLLDGLPGVSVEQGDAREVELGSPDAILLFDVLHYIAPEEQQRWLTRCAKALAPGGMLLVRELDSTAKKGNLAERLDRWAVRLGWNRGAGVQAWPIEQMVGLLEGLGFTVETQPAGKGLFSANALVWAKKKV